VILNDDDLRKWSDQIGVRLDEQVEMATEAARRGGVSPKFTAEMIGQIRAYRVCLDMLWHLSGHQLGRLLDPCDPRLIELRRHVFPTAGELP